MKTLSWIVKWACAFCLLVLFLFIETGFAQPPQGRGMPDSARTAAMVDTLAKRLSLSKVQKEKVSKIYFAAFEEGKKAFEKNQGDWQAMREARTKINEKRDNDVKALLTEEQKKIYDKFLQEQREQWQRRMGGRRPN
ncbi:MAG: hypothetical protein ONB44_00520 [candidate division KSB1 bacterium]|nr:hypothetical protein [candidate division KSB1 bacterium]MDZ7300604.1 hypothetical protein [candidate division KSB1 bacterium]MDZ7309741.1 hypothetical protein [candidate division KSB1 bacterium]